jgi:monoamine oxidase
MSSYEATLTIEMSAKCVRPSTVPACSCVLRPGTRWVQRHSHQNAGDGGTPINYPDYVHLKTKAGIVHDVIVIGGGAAGLAAHRYLARTSLSTLVLEARPRIGGRALTMPISDYRFDAGCHWLHSASQNPLTKFAFRMDVEAGPDPVDWVHATLDNNFSYSERLTFWRALKAFEVRLEEAAARSLDAPASDCLDRECKWNPLIEAITAWESGTSLSHLSVKDVSAYVDTSENWRIPKGYGSLIAMLAKRRADQSRIVTAVEVRAVDHSGLNLVLETSRGTMTARRAIVTIPTALLSEERIRFTPRLPGKIIAAAGLPLGFAEKVLLRINRPEIVPLERHVFGSISRARTGSYDLRPMASPYIEAFFGGDWARELVFRDELERFAIDELVDVFGSSFRAELTPVVSTSWSKDNLALGSYSYALTGRHRDRIELARPVDDRIFFAGEATSSVSFSTAHGAYATGVRAAHEAARSLVAHRVSSMTLP